MLTGEIFTKLQNYINKKLVDFLDNNFNSFPIMYLFKIKEVYNISIFGFINYVEYNITTEDFEDLKRNERYYYFCANNYIPKYGFIVLKVFNKIFTLKVFEKPITFDFIFYSILFNKGIFIDEDGEYIQINTDNKFIYVIPFNEIQRFILTLPVENKNYVNLIFVLYNGEKISVSLNLPQNDVIIRRFIMFLCEKIGLG